MSAQNEKATADIPRKRCWTVNLKSGKACTMIIEIECDAEEAFRHATDRFFNDVLIVY